jgi:hypothetical protein
MTRKDAVPPPLTAAASAPASRRVPVHPAEATSTAVDASPAADGAEAGAACAAADVCGSPTLGEAGTPEAGWATAAGAAGCDEGGGVVGGTAGAAAGACVVAAEGAATGAGDCAGGGAGAGIDRGGNRPSGST